MLPCNKFLNNSKKLAEQIRISTGQIEREKA